MADNRSHALQMFLSLVVAAIIVWLAAAWTISQIPLDRLPPEQNEELRDAAEERREERREAREEAREEREDERDGDRDNSGSGN